MKKEDLNKYLDKAKEYLKKAEAWLTDKKHFRYYGAFVVVILIIVILGSFTGTKKIVEGVYKNYTNESKNGNKEVTNLMNTYYKAYAKGDVKTIKKIAKPISDKEESYIKFFSKYLDKYEDIEVYSKKGLTNDSLLISVSMNIRFKGIKTKAAGLDFFYLKKGKDDKLYIDNVYSNFNSNNSEFKMDKKIVKLIKTFEKQDDVQKLQEKVQKKFNAAMLKDEKLNAFLSDELIAATEKWSNEYDEKVAKEKGKKTENKKSAKKDKKKDKKSKKKDEKKKSSKKKSSKSKSKKSKKTSVVYSKGEVAVYDSASTSGNNLGKLTIGQELKKIKEKGKKTENKKSAKKDKKKDKKSKKKDEKKKSSKKKSSKSKSKKSKKTSVVYSKGEVAVYDSASTSGNNLGKLTIGQELKKIKEKGDFVEIKYEDKKAYVEKKYLSDKKLDNNDVVIVEKLPDGKTVDLTGTVRLREGASENTKIVDLGYAKEPLTLHESYASGWTRVTSMRGITGYVKSEFIE